MTPMARSTHLRAEITHHPLRMASPASVVLSQAIPLLPTPLAQTPLCTGVSRGAILLDRTQDSLTPLGLKEQATLITLPCPLSSHLPYHQMS